MRCPVCLSPINLIYTLKDCDNKSTKEREGEIEAELGGVSTASLWRAKRSGFDLFYMRSSLLLFYLSCLLSDIHFNSSHWAHASTCGKNKRSPSLFSK